VRMTQICLSSQYLEQYKENPAALDEMVVHEMTHVAQHYYHPIIGRLVVVDSHPPSCWQEGIADYVCFKLGQTNGWRCAECDSVYPHYRSGYSCAGALLLYLEGTYNSNLARQLNTALRQGRYSDDFFLNTTGKDLEALWSEFQRTPAFRPTAGRMLALQQALGFSEGKPPKDIERRLKVFLDEYADAATRQTIKRAYIPGLTTGDVQARLAIVGYFTQPGGTAETYMVSLQQKNELPGFAKGQHGSITGVVGPRDVNIVFPFVRSFTATKQGDPSTYHYAVSRPTEVSTWKLLRAWRTDVEGYVVEEYCVQ
jgi:Peptidase of plants and bacteria